VKFSGVKEKTGARLIYTPFKHFFENISSNVGQHYERDKGVRMRCLVLAACLFCEALTDKVRAESQIAFVNNIPMHISVVRIL